MSIPEQPVQVSGDDKTWAMLCHLAAFAGFIVPFGNIIGPLIVWLVKRDQMPMVDDQGKESLNFQVSITIAAVAIAVVAAFLFPVPVIGWLFRPLLGLAVAVIVIGSVVLVIMAAIKAKEGVSYRYPIALRLIK